MHSKVHLTLQQFTKRGTNLVILKLICNIYATSHF